MNQDKVATAHFFEYPNNPYEDLLGTLRQACKKIAPVWPLENFVAVNPYLGLTDKSFENAAQDLAAAGGIQMTLPVAFYLNKLREGKMTHEDLATVLNKKQRKSPGTVAAFLRALPGPDEADQEIAQVTTVADVATLLTGQDWNRFVTARISGWAASYFDQGQAIWAAADQKETLFAAWRAEAEIDRTPELTGLKNFRQMVQALPQNPLEAARVALKKLGVPEEGMPGYLHRLLLRVGGWSAYVARLDWDSELYGGKDGKLIEFLTVLLCWEAGLLHCLEHPQLPKKWKEACEIELEEPVLKKLDQRLTQKLILQEAFDLAMQRTLIAKFKNRKTANPARATLVKAQAIFCIDVRSEVFRRNLELVDNQMETLGFAGFFAFPINYIPIGQEEGQAQCPVLLKTGPTILEEIPEKTAHQIALNSRIRHQQVSRVWKSFKSGAVTCFSFVSPMGLSYLPKLFTDSFGLTRPVPHPDKVGLKDKYLKKKNISLSVATQHNQTTGIPLDQQVQMAKNALKAMSLSDHFAPFVLIVGHGSTTVNNPHATGLDCGACGGHTGEANARVAAAVLNNASVREELQKENISITESTIFLACLHDTTTDEVTIYNEQEVPEHLQEALQDLKKSLALAGQAARTERSLRIATVDKSEVDSAMIARSKDWSQIRPEWGLAGCSAFVVAPRERTKNLDLAGRSFLHSYEWKKDRGFAVLELIMTAPMVVTSWISLQYYASTVDNKNFGAGNKTLHNVTAGVGVLEGYSGDLRVGLPWQSVHDGENYQHEPVRLNVIIEAPIEAINIVLKKHSSVRNLCDNGWLHLLAMNDAGKISHRYGGNLDWERVDE